MERFTQLASDMGKLWSKYAGMYMQGVVNTLVLALVATAIGCAIGFLCGILTTIPVARTDSPVKKFFLGLIRVVIRIYVEVFRGTPMILQAVFIYYGLPYFSGNAVQFTNKWAVAILVVSINTGAYMAESVRGGIISVDPGQSEGAMAIGMTHWQTMTSVVLPQAIRNIMPQIGNNYIINVKDTSVMFIIGFAAVAFMAGISVPMTLAASLILRKIEKRMDGKSDYELVQKDALTATAGTYSYDGSARRNPNREEEELTK